MKINWKKFRLPVLIVLFLALVGLPFYVDSASYTVILVTNILMYVVLALSWAIFSGPTGYISLASAAFFGVGVYASALFSESLPLIVVILIGGVASFCPRLSHRRRDPAVEGHLLHHVHLRPRGAAPEPHPLV